MESARSAAPAEAPAAAMWAEAPAAAEEPAPLEAAAEAEDLQLGGPPLLAAQKRAMAVVNTADKLRQLEEDLFRTLSAGRGELSEEDIKSLHSRVATWACIARMQGSLGKPVEGARSPSAADFGGRPVTNVMFREYLWDLLVSLGCDEAAQEIVLEHLLEDAKTAAFEARHQDADAAASDASTPSSSQSPPSPPKPRGGGYAPGHAPPRAPAGAPSRGSEARKAGSRAMAAVDDLPPQVPARWVRPDVIPGAEPA